MKEMIAIDIDDVMANENHAIMRFVNERYGLKHTPEEYDIIAPYWGYWEHVWGVDGIEGAERYQEFVKAKIARDIDLEPLPGAITTIDKLKSRYDFTVVTARTNAMADITRLWLQEHFANTFRDIHFVELWGEGEKVTKAKICQEIGAQYLLDDSVEHCSLADEVGIQALLFGDYGWEQS